MPDQETRSTGKRTPSSQIGMDMRQEAARTGGRDGAIELDGDGEAETAVSRDLPLAPGV